MNEYKIFQYRWDIAILALLYVSKGGKLVTIQKHFGISRGVLRVCLARLIEADLLIINTGYGHPMRPEYILTKKGESLGPFCDEMLKEGRKQNIEEVFQNRWSCPIIIRTGEQKIRFNELKKELVPVTSRALSSTVKFLNEIKCLRRDILDISPPSFSYSLGRKSYGLYSIYKEHKGTITSLNLISTHH